MENNGVLTAFVIVTAVAVVIQACVLLAMAIAARKTQQEALTILREVRGHLSPILVTAKDLLDDSSPKIKRIASNVEETSDKLREQSAHLTQVVDDVLRRTQKQVAHADAIVGQSLEAVDQTRASVTHLVMQPVKWATAVANGLRGGVENFMENRQPATPSLGQRHRPWEPEEEEILD